MALEAVYDSVPIGLCVLSTDARWLRINAKMAETNGLPAEAHIGRTVRELLPGIADFVEDLVRRVVATGEPVLGVERYGETPARPGARRAWRVDYLPLRNPDGEVTAVNVIAHEVTASRAAEPQRRSLLQLIEHSADLIGVADVDGQVTYMNTGGRLIIGLAEDASLEGLNFTDYVAPDSQLLFRDMTIPTARENGVWKGEMQLVNRRTGALVDVDRTTFALRDPDGKLTGYATVARDITVAKRSARVVMESEQRLRAMVDALPLIAALTRADGSAEFVNGNFEAYIGVAPDLAVANRASHLHPDDQARFLEQRERSVASGLGYRVEARLRRHDGAFRWHLLQSSPLSTPGSDMPARFVATATDIHDARMASARVAESEARLRLAYRIGRIGCFEWDLSEDSALYSGEYAELHGLPSGTATETFDSWIMRVHPDDRARVASETLASRSSLRKSYTQQYRITRQSDGAVRWIEERCEVFSDSHGRPIRVVGVQQDVTTQREAEAVIQRDKALLEGLVTEKTRDLSSAQARLAQAEKLTALGQLAGGIAHDFNNVIQATQGGATLIQRRADDPEAVRRLAKMILDASLRGMSVTQRLLGFARRSELSIEPVECVTMLTGLAELLQHTLGAAIEVRVQTPPSLPHVMADRSQLETVLINLATNARDAMPKGGTLTLVATLDVANGEAGPPGDWHFAPTVLRAGSYVRLALTDTGVGMPPDVLSRVTEPFFTTKPEGKGTGLGLAMASGFAEQSGGSLAVKSILGRGTTVAVWLPVAPAPGSGLATERRQAGFDPHKPQRSVLLVEDDPVVRDLLAEQLCHAGYVVLPAKGGAEALSILDEGREVDIVISDLSMPGMDGIAVIEQVHRRRPKLPAVILTGFASNVTDLAAKSLTGSFTLLRKPTTDQQLIEHVAMLLEGVEV
jgi:PAS domain S-box-containing protein